MSWVDRVTGKHRQVFDAPEVADGTVLHQARMWLAGYAEMYGTKDAEMSPVLVIRHSAIPMVFGDAIWASLDLGAELAKEQMGEPAMVPKPIRDPATGEPTRRNPFLASNLKDGAKYAAIWPDGGLDSLIARGATVLACGLALRGFAGFVAAKEKSDPKAAAEKLKANLVPGVIVMPSGIFAVTRAQEAGCQYLRAT